MQCLEERLGRLYRVDSRKKLSFTLHEWTGGSLMIVLEGGGQ